MPSSPKLKPLPLTLILACVFGGITAHAQSENAADVQKLGSITVQASADASSKGLSAPFAGGQVTKGGRIGVLGNLDNMSSPFSNTEYTSQLIQDQQAASVADILQNDPGVRVARGYGNYQQLYMIRGQPLYSDDITYNGLYGLLPRQYFASEFIERLDVFRGANAFLNGAAPGNSGLGGALNVVPKRAPNQDLTSATLGWESGGQGYGSFDLGRRFGPGGSTGVRLNAVRRDGGTEVDGEHRELTAVGLGLDWRGERARLSADFGYQDHRLKRSQPSVTFASGVPIPSAPDASANLAQDYTYSNERDFFGTLRGEYDITDNLTAWAAVGARNSKESSLLANPKNIDAAGNAAMNAMETARKDSVRTGEVGLRGKFRTGSIGHTVTASANFYSLDSRNAYDYYDTTYTNIYSPATQALPANPLHGGNLGDPLITQSTRNTSVAIADTMAFAHDRVLLTLGLRHQRIKNQSYDYNTGIEDQPENSTSSTTPVAGVVYKATKEISLYANYIEGMSQIGPAPTFGTPKPVNPGQTFNAVRTKQKEVGIKYDGGKLGGSLALFTMDMPTAYIDPVTALYGANGKQRNQGAELTFYGEPLPGVRLLGGATLLDAKQVDTAGGATDGNRAIGAPRLMANLGVEWDIPGVEGLTVTGRMVHTSSQYADAANTQEIPAWTRFDLGARYLTELDGHMLTLRANVLNVANKNYWASAGGYPGSSYLVLGAPRTFMLSASLEY